MTITTTTQVRTGAGRSRATEPSRPILRVAVLGDYRPAEPLIRELLADRESFHTRTIDLPATPSSGWSLSGFDVAVWADHATAEIGKDDASKRRLSEIIEALGEVQIGVVVLTSRPERFAHIGVGFVCLPPTSSFDMLRGAMLALHQCQPTLQALARELSGMDRVHKSFQRHFDAIDRELHLASRLQRDFLPRELPEDGPLRFSAFFRPCGWVSGDIFDIFRLDETRYGFYLADAVGHGVAAGLLTMYIKHAIKPKRITQGGYELVAPSEVLAALNDQLASQDLPDSQFITAWYGIINRETLRLDYAVAGHPPPMLMDASGFVGELHGEGGLLGLSQGQKFTDETIQLKPGQRIIVYSDGVEALLIEDRPPLPEMPRLRDGMQEILRADPDALRRHIIDLLDTRPGSLFEADDSSMVLLDIRRG